MAQTRSGSKLIWDIAAYAILILLAFICIFPLIWTFLTSIKVEADIVTRDMVYFPTRFTFEWYVKLWYQSGYPVLVINSLVVTSLTVLICLAHRHDRVLRVLAVQLSGPHAADAGLSRRPHVPRGADDHPAVHRHAAVSACSTAPGASPSPTRASCCRSFVWMLKGFFDAAPKELESAARIDGSTRIGAMLRIVIPIARNGLVATCVFVAIAAWNEYLFALMLTTSQGSRTWPVGLQLMVGEFQLPWGMLAAGGMISILPVIVLFAIVQRVMVAGITAGAVKG